MHFNCRGATPRRKKSSVRSSFCIKQVGDSFVLFPLLKSISFHVLDMPQGTLTRGSSVQGSYLVHWSLFFLTSFLFFFFFFTKQNVLHVYKSAVVKKSKAVKLMRRFLLPSGRRCSLTQSKRIFFGSCNSYGVNIYFRCDFFFFFFSTFQFESQHHEGSYLYWSLQIC